MIQKVSVFLVTFFLIVNLLSCLPDISNSEYTFFSAQKIIPGTSYTDGYVCEGDDSWFYFDVQSGIKYGVFISDKFLPGSEYTAYTCQSYYLSDGVTPITVSENNPAVLTDLHTEKVYVKIRGFCSSSEGTFGIKVSKEEIPSTSGDGSSSPKP